MFNKMDNKITDINDLVLFLAVTAMKPSQDNNFWQFYGYKKRPRHGSIWDRFSPKMFELENFISKELLTMGLIDVLNGIKKSTEDSGVKLLIAIGVVDQFLSTVGRVFPSDPFMENLFFTYDAYLKSEKSKIHWPSLLKANDTLGKEDSAKFMVGTTKLFAADQSFDGFLLKSDYIKNIIKESSKENKLKISMSDEMYKKYLPLLKEKILNI
jgi:hypothetical protein